MFVMILTEYSGDCWKLRNNELHGDTSDVGKKKIRSRLATRVRYLYGKQEELRGSLSRRIFEMDLGKRIKLGIHSLRLWIGKAEEVLKLHREEADRNMIDRWIRCW